MASRRSPAARSRRHGVVLGMLAAFATTPGHAADSCDLELDDAEKRYEAGAFEQAMASVEACLQGDPSFEARVQALEIRAKIELAADDVDAARQTVEQLLELDAGFQPARGDPTAFIQLVRGGRRVEVASVSKSSEPLAEAPAVVTIYTRDDLDRLQPRNLVELLELTTGFLIERDTDDVGIGARGIVTDNNQKFLITIDGHRVSNNNNFGLNPFHKSRHLIAMAERVEIIRGPGGLLWGPDAFLGLINVISRRPEDGEPPNEVRLTWGPSDDLLGASFSYLGDLGAADVSVFGDVFQSDGEAVSTELAGRGGFDQEPRGRPPDQPDLPTFWERIETPSVSLNARVDWHNGWIAAQFLRFNHSVEGLVASGVGQRDDAEQYFMEIAQRRRVGERQTLSLRLYADRANAGRRELEDAGDRFFFEFPETRFGTELLYTYQAGDNLSAIAGWDARYYDYQGGEIGPDITSPNGKSTGIGSLTTHGLFGQLSWRRGRFVLHLGGRWDTFSDDVDALFVPRVAAAYRAREDLGIKLLYTEGALRPSWTQLTGFFTEAQVSSGLKEESSRTLELQALWNPGAYDGTLSLYRTRNDDTINFLNGPQGQGFYNYADYTTTGIEWQNSYQLSRRLTAFGNLTCYLEVERDELVVADAIGNNIFGQDNPTFVIPGTDRPYNIPDYFFAAGLTSSWSPRGRPLDVTAIVRHKGKREIQGIKGQAEDREVATTYLDLKARYRIGPAELTVNGRNVLDDRKIVGIGTGQAGFVVPKGATWELALIVAF